MKKFLGLVLIAVIFIVFFTYIFFLKNAAHSQCVADLDQDNLGNTLHECDYVTYREVFFNQGKYRQWLKVKQQEKGDSDLFNERAI